MALLPQLLSQLTGSITGGAPQEEVVTEDVIARAPPQHKGMFGIKGTARDVLGVLGDAFLINSGRDPIYRPKRHQERIQDSLLNFSEDPLDAIKRLQGIDIKAGNTLFDNYNDAQAKKASNAVATKNSERQDAEFLFKKQAELDERLGGLAAAARADPQSWPMVRDLMGRIAARHGVPIPVEGGQLPEAYDERIIEALIGAGSTAKDRMSLEGQQAYRDAMLADSDARIAQADRNLRAQTALSAGRLKVEGIKADREHAERSRHNREMEATGKQNADTRAKSAASRAGQTVDGYNLRPGKRVGGKATLPNGKTLTWDGKEWK